jgi:hypothetical protein
MWSLPDISRLNAEAAGKRHRNKLERAAKTGKLDGKRLECEQCDKKATRTALYFDIFSDDPKGISSACDEHEDGIEEGFFFCEDCERRFVENYTWELYYHVLPGGEQICLNCWAKRHLQEEKNWVVLTEQAIAGVTFEKVRKAPHLIAVSGRVPEGLAEFGNVELDSSNGGRLTGFSSSENTPEGGVKEIQEILQRAREEGHQEAVLICDGAYQFSVSIGVYVRQKEEGRGEGKKVA